MKVGIVCVGSPGRVLAGPIAEYEARVRRYFELEVIEIRAGRGDPRRVIEEEGKGLLERLPRHSRVYALDRRGRPIGSRELAVDLSDVATYGPGSATWLIGGAFGLSPAVLEASDRRISLSALTLPHELARLLLVEQLYRAGTIQRGEPYHKGD